MAKIKFLLQSKSEASNIYIRYSINRSTNLKRKTGFIIDAKDWSNSKAQPIPKNEDLKKLKFTLDKLASFIEASFNKAVSEGAEFTGEWLQNQIDIFNNKKIILELDVLTNYINKYVETARYKQNQKREVGLSAGRIKNLKLFHNTIKHYEKSALKGKSVLIKDVNIQFVEKFKNWLFGLEYSVNYVGKNIDNLKVICNDAFKNDIETSTQLKNIKSISETKAPEDIIYLSEDEQDLIKKVELKREALINARKWLLLSCLIGQRGSDLLNITIENIKQLNGIKIIELQQQKTGKLVAIPLLPRAIEIIEAGFPYKISLSKYNEYIKDVCEEAKINILIKGSIKEKSRGPIKKGVFPKYKLITSHTGRRSFASNFYGRIPTPVLMNITAHSTEKTFLAYIGKTTYDNAYQMIEYFSKLTPQIKNNE